MRQRFLSPQFRYLKEEEPTVENRHSYLPQKTIKQLHMTKSKNTIIEKIQSRLALNHDVKVLDKTVFYLVCYVTHYQTIYNIVSSGLNNVEIFFDNFKNNQSPTLLRKKPSNAEEKQKQFLNKQIGLHKSRIYCNKSKPDLISHTERINHKSPEVQIIMDSYRYKCLKEFFHIQKYSQSNIFQTVFNKLHEKIVKGEINTVESYRTASIKRDSTNNHKRQASHPPNADKTQKTIKNTTFFPEIKLPTGTNLKKRNRKQAKKSSRFQTENHEQKTKMTSTSKSFQTQSRKTEIDQANKISISIENLKKVLNCGFSQGNEVTNIASDIKLKLDDLLNHIKVKPIIHEPKAKDNQLLKVR